MATNEVFKGDVGTILRFDVGVDSSSIQLAKILVRKPDNTLLEWNATPVSNSTKIEYIVREGDFNMSGIWKLQPYIELSDWKGYGSIIALKVNKNLEN